jgi:hypothetical protein
MVEIHFYRMYSRHARRKKITRTRQIYPVCQSIGTMYMIGRAVYPRARIVYILILQNEHSAV